MSSKLLATALILAFGLGLSACDKTIRGIGGDMRDTGQAVQDAAR
ncbi:EncA/B family entericidin [Methylobrevis pamukkalensis]|uniref:Entericidin B membrane lipoprotein n=1 Tax=Methylobrevis pamukkalensis TaxID=1439726 RepID=A0A1E3H0I7_9HYPH|nr:EncA/B family entericidin [Methylobrevis pamukkalensis]ODN69858.1 hypothetical protein A6302_02845 [Methylobrevis pamukkalensis]